MSEADAATRRQRSPRGEGEQLREELLDAAEALLIRKGSMDAVSIRAIVTDVGVTPPSLYLHFADKDELFFAVCERRFADFEEVLRAAADGVEDPADRVRAMGRAYVQYGVERAEHYQIIFGPGSQDVVRDRPLEGSAGMRALGLLVQAVEEAMAAGELATDDPWLTSLTIWSAVHGAVMMLLLSDDGLAEELPVPDPEVLADNVCDVVMRGLAA